MNSTLTASQNALNNSVLKMHLFLGISFTVELHVNILTLKYIKKIYYAMSHMNLITNFYAVKSCAPYFAITKHYQ